MTNEWIFCGQHYNKGLQQIQSHSRDMQLILFLSNEFKLYVSRVNLFFFLKNEHFCQLNKIVFFFKNVI